MVLESKGQRRVQVPSLRQDRRHERPSHSLQRALSRIQARYRQRDNAVPKPPQVRQAFGAQEPAVVFGMAEGELLRPVETGDQQAAMTSEASKVGLMEEKARGESPGLFAIYRRAIARRSLQQDDAFFADDLRPAEEFAREVALAGSEVCRKAEADRHA